MDRNTLTVAAALVAGGLLVSPQPGAGQALQGQVVVDGWMEPVPGAEVQLLNGDEEPVASALTDEQGRFAFSGLDPDIYYLVAQRDEARSDRIGPVDLSSGQTRTGVQLTIPSVLFDQAQACYEDRNRARRAAILAGFAYDPATDMPLPGSRVVVHWRGSDGEPHQLEGRTDAGGRYVLCEVPSSTEIRVSVYSLGRVSDTGDRIALRPAAIGRFDVPVELELPSPVRVLAEGREERAGTDAASLDGRVLDAETGRPIPAAMVALESLNRQERTDADGRFRFRDVPPGSYAFQVQRIGYDWDWESGVVEVEPNATMTLELRAAPRAVELEAVVVRVSTPEMRMARGASVSTRVLGPERIREAEERTAGMGDLMRELPSLQIRQGQFETHEGVQYGYCVESSRGLARLDAPEQQTTLPWCEMISVVIDGIETIRGGEALHMVRLREVESVELVPPLGALQWGERAAVNGALVIWTRGRGPYREGRREDQRD